ncbi:hypothetical protein KKF55_04125 [Patescibacteria group bacterium]|nr:hypothetical protein [Patescibacteria group bacterium]
MREASLTHRHSAPELLTNSNRFGQQHAKNVRYLNENTLRKYSPVIRNKILQGVFIDKTVGTSDDPEENSLTKEELAVLLELKALRGFNKNLEKINESRVSTKELLAMTQSAKVLHLISQLSNQSTDKKTEMQRGIYKYNNGMYLARSYKLVGNNYFKLEITKALIGKATSMDRRATALGSMKLMKVLLNGIEEFVLPYWLHNKDFTPLYANL